MSNSRNRVQSEYEPQLNQEALQRKLAVASNLVKFLDMSGERSVLEKMINVQPGISLAHRDSYPNEDMNAFLLRNDSEYSIPQALVREAIITCLENIGQFRGYEGLQFIFPNITDMGNVSWKDKHREIMLNIPIQEIASFDLNHMMWYIHFLHTGITIAPNHSIREDFITKFRELVSHEGIEPLVFLRILEILFEIRDIQFLREFVTTEREQKIEDLIRPDASPRLFFKVENPRDLPGIQGILSGIQSLRA